MMIPNALFNRFTLLVTWFLLLPVTFAAAEPVRIVALGDSLTAGYKLPKKDAFPVQLQLALRKLGHDVIVMNAGVSGDTAAAGLARLDWAVPEGTDAVILSLGANDALRGIDPVKTYEALTQIVARLKARDVAVLVAGMRAPPNMGAEYTQTFNRIHSYLAEHHEVILYPFFLDGVAGKAELNQKDGIHPTAEGIAEIVRRMTPFVEGLIKIARPASG
jgi:acyl-CoA thioesterase-1